MVPSWKNGLKLIKWFSYLYSLEINLIKCYYLYIAFTQCILKVTEINLSVAVKHIYGSDGPGLLHNRKQPLVYWVLYSVAQLFVHPADFFFFDC